MLNNEEKEILKKVNKRLYKIILIILIIISILWLGTMALLGEKELFIKSLLLCTSNCIIVPSLIVFIISKIVEHNKDLRMMVIENNRNQQ